MPGDVPGEVPGGVAEHELVAVVAEAERVAREACEVATSRAWAMAPQQRMACIEALVRASRVQDAARLALIRSMSKAEAMALGGTTVAGLLTWRLNVPEGRAAREVAAAAATDPDCGPLRQVGAALADGRIDVEHVDVAVRTLTQLPVALQREHVEAVDDFLASTSLTARPGQVARLAEEVLDRVDPDRQDRGFDPDSFARRSLSMTTSRDGMVQVRGQLDPIAGAQLKAAVQHFAKPLPASEHEAADGQGTVRLKDERTAVQRNADALGVLARQGLASGLAGTRGGEPPRIVVRATADQLKGVPGSGRAECDQTGPLAPAVLAMLARFADIQAVLLKPSGAVLALGRTARCFTPAQRRAMWARDGGCVILGCDAPFAQLEGHHVTDWALGGPTDVDNGCLGCGPHHIAIGLGIWRVRMVDGLPQVMAPPWVDPQRRWVTNPARARRDAAAALGQQLHLALHPPDEAAGGPSG